MSTFGERLRTLRRETGKTQKTVSAELRAKYPGAHWSQSVYSYWERADYEPNGPIMDELAAYFSVPRAYFYGDIQPGDLTSAEVLLLAAWRQGNYAEVLRQVAQKIEGKKDTQ